MKARNKKQHKTTVQLYRVTIDGVTHEFTSQKAAICFQRRSGVVSTVPAGDYHTSDSAQNPHKRRDVLSYKPGVNPGYRLSKEQKQWAELFPECKVQHSYGIGPR